MLVLCVKFNSVIYVDHVFSRRARIPTMIDATSQTRQGSTRMLQPWLHQGHKSEARSEIKVPLHAGFDAQI